MIARIWEGVTDASRADEYVGYLQETGLKEYRETPGNRGVLVLRRIADGRAEYLLLTLWDSLDSIRAFAGSDPEKAVYYPRDAEFLHARDPLVSHYDVVESNLTASHPPAGRP